LKVNIDEVGREQPRFRISQTGIGIEESQLKPFEFKFDPEVPEKSYADNWYHSITQKSDDGLEEYEF